MAGVDPRSPANRGWGWAWTPDPRQIGDGTPTPDPRHWQIGPKVTRLSAGARRPSARPFQAPPDFQSALLPHCGRDGPDSANSRPGPSSVSGRGLKFGGECEARLLGSESGCRSQATCECQCGPLVACCAVRKATEPGSVTYEPPLSKLKETRRQNPRPHRAMESRVLPFCPTRARWERSESIAGVACISWRVR